MHTKNAEQCSLIYEHAGLLEMGKWKAKTLAFTWQGKDESRRTAGISGEADVMAGAYPLWDFSGGSWIIKHLRGMYVNLWLGR